MFDFIGKKELEGAGVRTANFIYTCEGLQIGVPFHLGDLVKKFGKQMIPDVLGIYHLFYNDNLTYVGMSKKLRGRLLWHLKDDNMPFTWCMWFCAETLGSEYIDNVEAILRLESNMIKALKPSMNTQHISRY